MRLVRNLRQASRLLVRGALPVIITHGWPAGLHTSSLRLPVEGELPSFAGATGWLKLSAADA